MKDQPKHFYVKFKINDELGIMEGLKVSEDLETIEKWAGLSTTDKPEQTDAELSKDPVLTFKQVGVDLRNSIRALSQTAVFIMTNMMLLRLINNDIKLRKYVTKYSEESIDSGSFETHMIGLEHMEKFTRRMRAASVLSRGSKTLPSLFVIGLVSAYDAFLSKLIRCIFLTRSELMSSSERNISFRDLMEFGSVDAARDRVIEKEIESVLRENHATHVEWLEKKLAMKLKGDFKNWPYFIELCERRNLLVHTGGTVSTQYLFNCKQHGADISGIAVGDTLEITLEYVKKAAEIILEFGTKLTQVIWRKLIPSEIDMADVELNKLAYDLIGEQRYDEAVAILKFGLYDLKKHGQEKIRKQMVVNLANATKLSGNEKEAENIIMSEDWSAASNDYIICVAAVRDDISTVLSLMKSVVDANLMRETDFQHWPVFQRMRSNPAFVETFEREFDRKITPDQEAGIILSEDNKVNSDTKEEQDAP